MQQAGSQPEYSRLARQLRKNGHVRVLAFQLTKAGV